MTSVRPGGPAARHTRRGRCRAVPPRGFPAGVFRKGGGTRGSLTVHCGVTIHPGVRQHINSSSDTQMLHGRGWYTRFHTHHHQHSRRRWGQTKPVRNVGRPGTLSARDCAHCAGNAARDPHSKVGWATELALTTIRSYSRICHQLSIRLQREQNLKLEGPCSPSLLQGANASSSNPPPLEALRLAGGLQDPDPKRDRAICCVGTRREEPSPQMLRSFPASLLLLSPSAGFHLNPNAPIHSLKEDARRRQGLRLDCCVPI